MENKSRKTKGCKAVLGPKDKLGPSFQVQREYSQTPYDRKLCLSLEIECMLAVGLNFCTEGRQLASTSHQLMQHKGPGAPHPHLQVSNVHLKRQVNLSRAVLPLSHYVTHISTPMLPSSACCLSAYTIPALFSRPGGRRRRVGRKGGRLLDGQQHLMAPNPFANLSIFV